MICRICGEKFNIQCYLEPNKDICDGTCYITNKIWEERARLKKEKRLIIIDGEVYADKGKTQLTSSYNEFGGKNFKIKMNSGEIIDTNNLWHGGSVPEFYAKQLEDNAIFL